MGALVHVSSMMMLLAEVELLLKASEIAMLHCIFCGMCRQVVVGKL